MRAADVVKFALAALMLLAVPAQAHVGFGASQRVTITPGMVSLDLRLTRDHLPGFTLPVEGPAPAAVTAAVLAATRISVGGRACAGRITDSRTRRAANIVVVEVRFACPSLEGPYRLGLGGPAALGMNALQYVEVVKGGEVQGFLRGSTAMITLDANGRAPPIVAPAYFALGVEHIALGLDHLAFLAALLVGARGFRRAAALASVFAVAHTVTLALVVLGRLHPDATLVEPLIALSIAAAAAEGLARQPSLRAFLIAGGFGLIHGLGFGAGLAEVGLPTGARALAITSFTIGIEAAQLAALALCAWALARLGDARRSVERAVSIALLALGLLWAASRAVGWLS